MCTTKITFSYHDLCPSLHITLKITYSFIFIKILYYTRTLQHTRHMQFYEITLTFLKHYTDFENVTLGQEKN